ncbi:hypothetical protein QJS10_CPB19g01286 [Acorus calamus]|uniref:Transmembrane protein n=1 Tax=Acorus calamus TaxID=4465 RepID=A0AAV9CJC2_ACOCL|nr:hypothetical protein QJS10_CPB19g01286 [Acorus calamus]
MESSGGVGLMAVMGVSGFVALVALQVHKRLVSDFMKKVESELGNEKCRMKRKRVRFAKDVVEPSSNSKEYRRRHSRLINCQ